MITHPAWAQAQAQAQTQDNGAPFFNDLPVQKTFFSYTPNTLPPFYNAPQLPIRLGKQKQSSFIEQQIQFNGATYQWLHTAGSHTAMGELVGNNEHWLYFTTPQGTWSADISSTQHLPQLFENDVVGQAQLHQHHLLQNNQYLNKGAEQRQSRLINGTVVVDVMLLFTNNIVNAYPGEMTQTLMAHLINKANQTFVNSNINVQLRLVRSELVNYRKPSNFDALDDLTLALDANTSQSAEPSLASVRQWREQSGADLVAMIRTHDLIERDVCGVARFPNSNTDVLVNISNVGISGGSNCVDTFTHEVGHNFGAGHQAVNGQGQGALPGAGALLIPGKFNTIMSSIGTGDDNRARKLNVFSNVETQCGGRLCGDTLLADNASTIEAFALQNANLREPTQPLNDIVLPLRTFPDRDNDGVNDASDAFPFEPSESQDSDNDGIGDNADAFANDPSEFIDSDNDGIGNEQDPDDDNDGTPDVSDDLPLDPNEIDDSDGDGVGNNVDALDNDFREFADTDNDGIGDVRDIDDDNDGVFDFNGDLRSNTNMIVVSANTHQLLEFDALTGEFIGVLATMPEGSLTYRSDMVIDPDQSIVFFVAESDVYTVNRQNLQVNRLIDRSDMSANFPENLALDQNGSLFVTNSTFGADIIERFDITAAGILFGGFAQIDGLYRGLALRDNGQLLIADYGNNRLIEGAFANLSANPREIASQGMNKPDLIAIDSNGQIFVANVGDSSSISRYDSNGAYLGVFISGGTQGLTKPTCLAAAANGFLYVCDGNTNRILRFDIATGAFVDTIVSGDNTPLDKPMGILMVGKPLDAAPFDPNNDSDNDGVANISDDLPLDPLETVDTDSDGIGNNADSDDDNDGMPDAFEVQFEFNPLDASDASGDPDNDGITNLSEFNAGTDPRTANVTASPPQNGGASDSSGGAVNRWLIAMLLVLLCWRRGLRSPHNNHV